MKSDDHLRWVPRPSGFATSGDAGRYIVSVDEATSTWVLEVRLHRDGVVARHPGIESEALAKSFASTIDLNEHAGGG